MAEPPQEDGSIPPELLHCPPGVLEAYVRRRIQRFNSQPALAQRLGPQAADVLWAATAELLTAAAGSALAGGAGPPQDRELQLVFRHDCRHLCFTSAQCMLCAQSQARRCAAPFASKYLVGDPLRAPCGAAGRVELVDRATGKPVTDHQPLLLQACIVDAQAHAELARSGPSGAPADADLERIALISNQQGQPLLVAKGAPADAGGRLLIPLSAGSAVLPDLSVTGSSEALLSGKKASFALLLRAVDPGSGQRRRDVPPAVSDAFVVATQRVRTAAKKAIPHVADPVSKIASVGAATQAKLRDLGKSASEAGVQGLALPLAAVTTVGEFRQLVEWAVQEPTRCEQVRKMLKLQKGWEEARDHALKAVGDDSRLRAFFADDARSAGLLFGCRGATPLLEDPLATLEAAKDDNGEPTLRATLACPAGPQQAQHEELLAEHSGSGGSPAAAAHELQRVKAMLQQAKVARGSPSPGIVLGAAGGPVGGLIPSPFLHQPSSPFLPPTPASGATLAAASPLAAAAAGTKGSAMRMGSSARGSLSSRLLQSLSCTMPTQPRSKQPPAAAAAARPLPLHVQLAAAAALSEGMLMPASPFASEDRQPSLPTLCLATADPALPQQAAVAAAAAALPALSDAKPLSAAAKPQSLALAVPGQQGGLAAAGAGGVLTAAAPEQGLGRHASPGSVDWAQLLLEAYKPEGSSGSSGLSLPPSCAAPAGPLGASPSRGLGGPLLSAPALEGRGAALLKVISSVPSAAAQELLATLSGMDWDTIASLDWGDPPPAGLEFPGAATAEGPAAAAAVAAAGAAGGGMGLGGPVPLPPDWSKLLSLSPADWAAALQDLHSHQQPLQQHHHHHQQEQQEQQQQQKQGAGAAAAVGDEAPPAGELQQEISLWPPQMQEQQQQQTSSPLPEQQHQPPPQQQPPGLQRQSLLPTGHKRTHSKISPISSGLEDMKLGSSSGP
ncbi:hypothetical protein ABPG75_004288 [Micractinium tetrahymenae]